MRSGGGFVEMAFEGFYGHSYRASSDLVCLGS